MNYKNNISKKEVKNMTIEQQEDKKQEEKIKCQICGEPITLKHDNIVIQGEKPQNYTLQIPDYCSQKCRTAGEL